MLRHKTNITVVAVLLCVSSFASPATGFAPRAGLWHAWLDSPGGKLPFDLQLTHKNPTAFNARIINGLERIKVPSATWDGQKLTINIDYYASRIVARTSTNQTSLDGEWERRGPNGAVTKMAFHARLGQSRRFRPGVKQSPLPLKERVDGRWAVRFSGSDDLAIGIFERRPAETIDGTFLTTTGDYRYLSGTFERDRLRLSCFDGAHAFLFDAKLRADGTLRGDFWSRDTWHETWTATRDEQASLPNLFAMTKWNSNAKLGDLSFPDLDGKTRSLIDPAFVGKARIIEVFGSWCPNCNDATKYLVELDKRYRERGLRTLGLAFEFSGDLARDTKQVKTYAKHHRIEYPILIAGVSDKAKASAALPILDRVRAYPTTIFLDKTGMVKAIYTGFSGPATGEAHTKLRAEFERIIEELLAE